MMPEASKGAANRTPTRLTIRNPQDFWGGLALVALALFVLWASRDLPGMRGFAFGPGTAPRLFAVCVLVLSAGIVVAALFTDGERIGQFSVRGPIVVAVAIFAFAWMIRPLGLVIATFASFMIAVAGSSETRWIEATIAAAAFTLGAVLLFVYALGLPFQIWPRF